MFGVLLLLVVVLLAYYYYYRPRQPIPPRPPTAVVPTHEEAVERAVAIARRHLTSHGLSDAHRIR